MSDTNQDIVNRVLARLRETPVPANLEQRVLAAVQSRAEAKPLLARPPWKFALFAAGAAFTSAVFVVTITHRPVSSYPVPKRTAETAHAVREQSKIIASEAKAVKMIAKSRAVQKAVSQRTSDSNDETVAVSFPAPPMPLTDQENLLLRIAHKGDPVQLAMLDPQQRDQRNAAEKAEFKQFFEPSIPGDPQ